MEKSEIIKLLNRVEWTNEYKAEFIDWWITKARYEGIIEGVNKAFDALNK